MNTSVRRSIAPIRTLAERDETPAGDTNVQQVSGGLNILLLSDDRWTRTVGVAVAGFCGAVVHQVRSLPAALAQMAREPRIACVLVQAGRCTGGLRQLADTAHAGRTRPAPMFILGGVEAARHAAPAHSESLWAPTSESLSRLLASLESSIGKPEAKALPSQDVSTALDASRLVTRYQPIVCVADRKPIALEVLARLEHPRLGTLVPAQFVPQIEGAGLARRLTEAVVENALADHTAHLRPFGLSLTINFPLDVLMHQEFTERLEQRCAQAGVTPSSIIIELTESQPVAFLDGAGHRALARAMTHMRRLGYRFAIDDFGPEMPRRHELFALPFDLLKLDKSVVVDPAHVGLVEQAVTAAHAKGLKVIAEGVEDQPTWSRMQTLGVDYVQGFLISRPLPAPSVGDWLAEWRTPHA